jgi:hypothetical protein
MALGTPVVGATVYSGIGNALNTVCPSGVNPNDALVLIVGQKPNTSNTNGGTSTPPTGWSLQVANLAQGGYGTTNGADVGNTNLWFYTKDVVDGTEGGATFTTTLTATSAAFGFIVRVPSSTGQISYGTATGSQASTPTSPLSVTFGSDPGFTAGDVALWAMSIPTDDVTPNQFSDHTISAAGVTFGSATELNEPDSTINNDIGGYSAWASVSSGTSSGAATVGADLAGTLTNVRGPVSILRIREARPLIVSESNVPITSQTVAVTAGAQLAISESNVPVTSEPMAIEAEQPVSEGGHYGAWWRKQYEKQFQKPEELPTIEEVQEFVEEEPEKAVEAIKQVSPQIALGITPAMLAENRALLESVAKQLRDYLQYRAEEDDIEFILMMI